MDERTAYIKIMNESGRDIEFITVNHKYSDVYKESETWLNLPALTPAEEQKDWTVRNNRTQTPMVVHYHTGFGTTGKDWWRVSWKFKGDPGFYTSNPNNFRREVDALESLGQKALPMAGAAAGSFAGGAAGGAAGTFVSPGVGTTVGTWAGKAAGGAAGKAAATALSNVLMNGESTVGFKQHMLESDDNGRDSNILIYGNGTMNFSSHSGHSDTVYIKAGNVVTPPAGEAVAGAVQAIGIQFQKDADVGGGAFTSSVSPDGKTQWVETSGKDPNFKATFTEKNRDKDWVFLFDASRNLTVALPVAGGMSQWSQDGGQTWNKLCNLTAGQAAN